MPIYLDADACPVKEEVYRVARRYVIKVYVVANAPLLGDFVAPIIAEALSQATRCRRLRVELRPG